jgi:hypothetical protein
MELGLADFGLCGWVMRVDGQVGLLSAGIGDYYG